MKNYTLEVKGLAMTHRHLGKLRSPFIFNLGDVVQHICMMIPYPLRKYFEIPLLSPAGGTQWLWKPP